MRRTSDAFWLLDYRGVGQLAAVASALLSGMYVPIAFFPEWLAILAWPLPFAAMIQAPIESYLGHVHGVEFVGLLSLQAFCGAALLLLGRASSRRACRSWRCRVAEMAEVARMYRRLVGARVGRHALTRATRTNSRLPARTPQRYAALIPDADALGGP